MVLCRRIQAGGNNAPSQRPAKVEDPKKVAPAQPSPSKSKTEAPKVEPPKPKVEPPKPKAEPPKVEAPKVEPPKIEPPKPKPESPKSDLLNNNVPLFNNNNIEKNAFGSQDVTKPLDKVKNSTQSFLDEEGGR